MFYVYKIVNDINDKVYVGRTIRNLNVRWNEHIKSCETGDSRHIYSAMRKYGIQHFHIELVESCTTYDDMVAKEAYYCELYQAYTYGYNMTPAGEANPMECEVSKKSHTEKMRSDCVKSKISSSMKAVRSSEMRLTMFKNETTKRIPFDEVASYLADGWIQGAYSSYPRFYDGIHIQVFRGNDIKYILPHELFEYKNNGWRFSPNSRKDLRKDHISGNEVCVEGQKRIRLHKEGVETTIWESDLRKYIESGWKLGGKPGRMSEKQKIALSNSHGKLSEDFKTQQSKRLKDFYKKNPDFKTKSKHALTIMNPETLECIDFPSRLDFCRFAELPDYIAKEGVVSSWIKSGYIKRKNSKFNGWKIFDKV